MSTHALRPWTDLVKLHPDVEAGALTEAVFAIDLGAIAANDSNMPVVNRDPEAFFRATYLTADLQKLLGEVLASLAGTPGYNRVLKLRTPFGGGKSHTLAALLHAARNRKVLDGIPEAKDFERPKNPAVAVFDGEKFDAKEGKTLEDGRAIQTMWGWIAWQLGEDKYRVVEGHDKDRVAPAGDKIREMLAGGPKLILLDEVLKYMERAAAVSVLDSTLQRQAKDFFQNLTVEVSNSRDCALVYSLAWSSREALGNIALLQEIDHLASRVDQSREPVSGVEILYVLQKRLLAGPLPASTVKEVGETYSEIVTNMMSALAETQSAKRQAEEDGLEFRNRVRAAYPFHPALIDAMKERWCSLDHFQRTRGALRFLASCLHALKLESGAKPLLGPGDVPLRNPEVRRKMLNELGAQNDYDPVITADIVGPNSRAKKIDDRMAQETPAMSAVKPAARVATAVFIYSFGGLKRGEGEEGETLPPGVTESELLQACVGPDLDSVTARAVLSDLRNTCLYLHYDGVRYCFKKDPNVTKLIEDAEQAVAREEIHSRGRGPVRAKIKEMLESRLAGHHTAIVWPTKSHEIPDTDPRFLVAYLPLEFAPESKVDQERQAIEFLSKYGDRPRRFKNGLGLAIPNKRQLESLRRAVRYLLAIDRVEEKKKQLRLSSDQLDQLKERKRTEQAAAESSFRELYTAVWFPRIEEGKLIIEAVERGGRPLQAAGIHERIMELLTAVSPRRIHGLVTPAKIADRVRLGQPLDKGESVVLGIKTSDVLESFFRDIAPPRLESAEVLRSGISRGVSGGIFAYASGEFPVLGEDNKFQISLDRVLFGRAITEDEIDLESGYLIVPSALPAAAPIQPPDAIPTGADIMPPPVKPGAPTGEVVGPADKPPITAPGEAALGQVKLIFQATREQVYKAFPAIANLADKSDGGKVKIRVEGSSADGYDPAWLRNAVDEPLDEADIDRISED